MFSISLTSPNLSYLLTFLSFFNYKKYLHSYPYKFYCFPSVTADALTQVFPSQTKSNLLSHKKMFDIVTNSGIRTNYYDNPSTQLDTTPPFRLKFLSFSFFLLHFLQKFTIGAQFTNFMHPSSFSLIATFAFSLLFPCVFLHHPLFYLLIIIFYRFLFIFFLFFFLCFYYHTTIFRFKCFCYCSSI